MAKKKTAPAVTEDGIYVYPQGTVTIRTKKKPRERSDYDFYPTERWAVAAALSTLPNDFKPATILDPGAGSGRWGEIARRFWPEAQIIGTEIRDIPKPLGYDEWIIGDYMMMDLPKVDLVIGNPPYGRDPQGNKVIKYGEHFIRKSLSLSRFYTVQLMRMSFIGSKGRAQGIYREHPLWRWDIYADRPSFLPEDDPDFGQTEATEYAVYSWKTGYTGKVDVGYLFKEPFAGWNQDPSTPQQLSFF